MKKNDTFWMNEEMYLKPDVQNAVSKKYIVVTGDDAPKSPKLVRVTNISVGSVTVPGIGVMRSGESKMVGEDKAKAHAVLEMKKAKVIKVGVAGEPEKKTAKTSPKKNTQPAKKWNPITWTPKSEDGKDAVKSLPKQVEASSPKKKSKRGKKKDSDEEKPENLLLDLDADGEEEAEEAEGDDSVTWVDDEDAQRRLASHPILGKKNAGNRKRKR
jgi:hypothetical protein